MGIGGPSYTSPLKFEPTLLKRELMLQLVSYSISSVFNISISIFLVYGGSYSAFSSDSAKCPV